MEQRHNNKTYKDLAKDLHELTAVKEMKETEGWKILMERFQPIYELAIEMSIMDDQEHNERAVSDARATARVMKALFNRTTLIEQELEETSKGIGILKDAEAKREARRSR